MNDSMGGDIQKEFSSYRGLEGASVENTSENHLIFLVLFYCITMSAVSWFLCFVLS